MVHIKMAIEKNRNING